MKIITHTLFIFLLFYTSLFANEDEPFFVTFEMMKGSSEYKDIMLQKKERYAKYGLQCYIIKEKDLYSLRCNDTKTTKQYKDDMKVLDSLGLQYKVISLSQKEIKEKKLQKKKPKMTLGDGYKYFNEEKFDKAKKIFLELYKYNQNLETTYAVALSALQDKQYSQVRDYLKGYLNVKKAKKLFYDSILAEYYDLIALKDYTRAIYLKNKYKKMFPELKNLKATKPDPDLGQGYKAFNAKKYKKAYRIFKLNYEKNQNEDTAYAMALISLRLKDYPNAYNYLRPYKDKSKKSRKLYYDIIVTQYYDYINQKKYKKAFALQDKFIKEFPKLKTLIRPDLDPNLGDGYKAFNAKDYKKAYKIFKLNYKKHKNEDTAYAMALISLRLKKYPQAYNYLRPYKNKSKKSRKLYYDIIVTQYYDYINQKKYKKAFALQDRFIKEFPKLKTLIRPDLDPTLKDGYDAFNAKKYKKAYKIFKLNYKKKQNFDTAYALALVYMQRKNYAKVRELLEPYRTTNKKASGLFYDSIVAEYYFYVGKNQQEKAIALRKKYQKLYPKLKGITSALLSKADQLIAQKKYFEAEEFLIDNGYEKAKEYIFKKKYADALKFRAQKRPFKAIDLILPYVATYPKAAMLYRDITFDFVIKHLQDGDYARAKELLKPIASSSKKATKLYLQVRYAELIDNGWKNFNQKKRKLALENFKEACEISYQSTCLEGQMSAEYKLKHYKEALALVEKVYALKPSQEAAFIGFVSALKLKKYNESNKWYEKLDSKKEALLRLEVNKGMNEDIRKKYEKELKRNPNDFELVVNYLDFLKAAKYYNDFELTVNSALNHFYSPIQQHILKRAKREYQNSRFFEYYSSGENEECYRYGKKIIQDKDEIGFKRMHGWCAFKSGHYEDAQKIFDKINNKYGETKDDLYAEYLSALNAHKMEDADKLLDKLYALSVTQDEEYKIASEYLTINRLDKAQRIALGIVDKDKHRELQKKINTAYRYGSNKRDSATVGIHYKTKSIEDGYHSFTEYYLPIDLDFYDSALRHYYIDADIIHLYDEFKGSQNLHTMEYGYGYRYADTKSFATNIVMAKFGAEFQYLSVELGSTPFGAILTPLPLGKINLHTANEKLNVFAQYSQDEFEDSMLSFVGNSDVDINNQNEIIWGRIVKSGATVGISYNAKKVSFGVSGSFYNKIYGDNVFDNSEKKVIASLVYRDPTSNYAYLDYSLLGVYDSFKYNSDLLTYGHGGYFSPQKFYLLSAAVDLAKNFNKEFYWRVKFSLGYQKFSVDDVAKFPIADAVSKPLTNKVVNGYDADGIIGKVGFELGYKLDNQTNLVGAAAYEKMDGFSTLEFGIFLNYAFDPSYSVNIYHLRDEHRVNGMF